MKLVAAVLVWIAAFTLLAAAQNAPGTIEELIESDYASPAKSVFVIGDSLAGGLGAGMKRLSTGNEDLSVQLRYQDGSGLARTESYDWADAVARIAESTKIGVAIVMIGANDVRSIRDGEFIRPFGTPEWTAAYTAQIDRLIASLKQTGAELHWVSLPPMANPEYDAAIAAIEKLQKARVEAAGISYIDIRKDLVNPDGSYMERGPDDTGTIRKLRDRDGVSFMKVGNNKIGSLVLAALDNKVEVPTEQPAVEVAPLPSPAAPAVAGSGPIFGQMAAEGVVNVIRPASTAIAGGQPLPVNAADLVFAEGSAAQRLFINGHVPQAEPGRFDDFSYSE